MLVKSSIKLGSETLSEEKLWEFIESIIRLTKKVCDSLKDIRDLGTNQHNFQVLTSKLRTRISNLDKELANHPAWGITHTRKLIRNTKEWIIFLALVGKATGWIDPDDELFTGDGLACSVADSVIDIHKSVSVLSPDAFLIKNGYVRACGGIDNCWSYDITYLKTTIFELTGKSIRCLGLSEGTRIGTYINQGLKIPQTHLNHLALPNETRESLGIALSHYRGLQTLMVKWGLGERIMYGRGMTMLFYGPPGTGKTATAEAVAHELKKPLMVADYSQIQNRYVGETEKQIVMVFNSARQNNAVLFWDEADAMFFDRNFVHNDWDIRNVNILLQEVERFEGVCILSTNRDFSLDKALERRISVKIPFPKPDYKVRIQIWKKIIPAKLPLSKDVNFINLGRADLSGGEIKNVILNAARLAFERSSQGPVTMNDFEKAIKMEHSGINTRKNEIGF